MFLSMDQDPCYQVGYTRPGSKQALVQGTGDADACQDKIRALFFSPVSRDAPGSYPGEIPLQGRFAATENFFNVRDDLKLPLIGKADAMAEAAQSVCKESLGPSAIEQVAKGGHPLHCFAFSYQVVLLAALRAHTTPSVELQIGQQIGGSDVDWALGAAVVQLLQERDHGSIGSNLAVDAVGLAPISAWASVLVLVGLVVVALRLASRKLLGDVVSKAN